MYAVCPESLGNKVDEIAEKVGMISGVDNCAVADVRRAIELD